MSLTAFSQSKITYSEMQTFAKGWEEDSQFDEYTALDGHTYKVGDTIKVGRPSSNKSFSFIQEGSGVLSPANDASVSISGNNTIIKKIYVIGNKNSGFKIMFQTKGVCGICPKYYIDAEQAFATEELVSLGMTSEKALSALKVAKEKLDLGIITLDEYNKIKQDLIKYIK